MAAFALLFGTTWLVNALAITGVLTMSLAANHSQFDIEYRVAYNMVEETTNGG